jgi:undecaprenyl diphosphate synthase
VHAAKTLARKVKEGLLDVNDITETMLSDSLWTAGMPDPELIIRTGTGQAPRLSNYLLYQAAYSEIMFLDHFWPEVTEEILNGCIEKFKTITRNFGN